MLLHIAIKYYSCIIFIDSEKVKNMTNTIGKAQQIWQLLRALAFFPQHFRRCEKIFEIMFDRNSQSIKFSCLPNSFNFYF